MRSTRTQAFIWATSLSLSLGVGCSSCDDVGNKPPAPKLNNLPNNNTNNVTPDMASDQGADMGDMGDMALPCEDNDCIDWKTFDSCMRVRDLGTIDARNAAGFRAAGDTTNLGTLIQTSCSNSGDVSAEYVYAFKLNTTAFIDLKVEALSGVDFVAEVRQGKCEDDSRLFCRQSAQQLFRATAGEQYFLVVEAQNGLVNGPFNVLMEFTPTVCDPGARSCAGDDLTICADGTSLESLACGTMCNVDACAADTCANAIELRGSGTFDFSGELSAFVSSFNAAQHQGCEFGVPIPTPGADQVFALRDLKAGQRVIVEANSLAEDANDNAIFILDTCGASATCIAKEEINDRLDWEVPADGDYFLVIDNLSDINKNYKHSISITTP